MKSIKEKAEESSLGYDEVQAPAIGRGFVLGVNYVLEQITEAIRVCDNDRNTDLYKSLWNCIDELRK